LDKGRLVFLMILALSLGLAFSGCGIFQNEIEPMVEEIGIADTLNSFVSDYNDLVGAYLEQLKDLAEDPEKDQEDPAKYDLEEEFATLLEYYDLFLIEDWVVSEEAFKEKFIEDFLWEGPGKMVTEENVEKISYRYRYFNEIENLTELEYGSIEYSQEPLRLFQAFVETTITNGNEETIIPGKLENNNQPGKDEKKLEPFTFALVEYEDEFKVFRFFPFGIRIR